MTKRVLFLLLFPALLCTCGKNQQYVPDTYVNLTVYVNDPQNSAISIIGGWKYYSGGYRGLLIYHKSQSEFVAYDRACPYKVEDSNAQVYVDTSNNVILKDNSCGSQFLLSDGKPISGEAVVPLKQYRVVYDGTTLQVTN